MIRACIACHVLSPPPALCVHLTSATCGVLSRRGITAGALLSQRCAYPTRCRIAMSEAFLSHTGALARGLRFAPSMCLSDWFRAPSCYVSPYRDVLPICFEMMSNGINPRDVEMPTLHGMPRAVGMAIPHPALHPPCHSPAVPVSPPPPSYPSPTTDCSALCTPTRLISPLPPA